MRLLTEKMKDEIEKKYPLYSQDGMGENATCVVKFFLFSWTWYILEGRREEDDFIMFGIVLNGMGDEYGYVSLKELESVSVHGFQVERDSYFEIQKLLNINDPHLHDFLTQITV